MRTELLAFVLVVSGCAAQPTCPVDPTDAGCVTAEACSDAGDDQPCSPAGLSCRLCLPSYHSYTAECRVASDGGVRWAISRGIPPPGCPPE